MTNLSALSPEQRTLLFLTSPVLWPHWPCLPLVRRFPDREEQLGIVYDALGVSGTCGYSATVLLTNLFLIPETEAELLALPKEVYDTAAEIAGAGWCVD